MENRLHVSAGYRSIQGCSTSLRDYVPYDERERLPTSITLSLEKPPRKVAAEISRRMLAKLNPAVGSANEADERARQAKEYRAAWQARFRQVSGGRLEHAYHEKNALRSKEGRDVEIKEYYRGESFSLDLREITAEQVETILRMVYPAPS